MYTLPKRHYQVLLSCASKDAGRAVLEQLFFDGSTISAADGSVAVTLTLRAGVVIDPPSAFGVTAAHIKAGLKGLKATDSLSVDAGRGDREGFGVLLGASEIDVPVHAWAFPPLKSVFESAAKGPSSPSWLVDPTLLGPVAAAGKLCGPLRGSVTSRFSAPRKAEGCGEGPAVVVIEDHDPDSPVESWAFALMGLRQ